MELVMAEVTLASALASVLPYVCVATGEWLRGRIHRSR